MSEVLHEQRDDFQVVPSDITDYASRNELAYRFEPCVISELTRLYVEHGLGFDAKEALGDKQFLISYISGDSPYIDIPLSIERDVFSRQFGLEKEVIDRKYGMYNSQSTFAVAIDVSTESPVPAGVLRIVDHDPVLGFKDINDLLSEDPEINPWIDDIKTNYFKAGEAYDPAVAWAKLCEREGEVINLEESLDIVALAAADPYRDKKAAIGSVSILLFHSCLRYALANGKKNLLAIMDIPPFDNLQQFGEPFNTFSDLGRYPYDGDDPTVPVFSVIDKGMRKIREFHVPTDGSPSIGDVLINGVSLDFNALLPKDYDPANYSDEAVGL